MSFVLMQHVFYKSRHHGNAKVLLLALADYANDCCGLAWPAVDTLAAKVGINPRNTHKLLKQVSTGPAAELEILLQQGPQRVNLYRLRGVSLETGCRDGHGVSKHQKGCPWRQGGGVSRDRGRVSLGTDNLSVELSVESSESQASHAAYVDEDAPAVPPCRQCYRTDCTHTLY